MTGLSLVQSVEAIFITVGRSGAGASTGDIDVLIQRES